jgi:uncharacterized protein DUF4338
LYCLMYCLRMHNKGGIPRAPRVGGRSRQVRGREPARARSRNPCQLSKYLVWGQSRPLACLAWSSAPRHLGARDRYIGWNAEARLRNLRFIAYNTRFLILPWVTVEHLASHILGRMASRISADWQRIYGHPIYFLETFVDPERFRGTCYRAANWVLLGKTTGRGKQSNSYVPNRSIKEVLGYPLAKQFRELLMGAG